MKKHIDNEEILDSMVFDIGDNAVSHFETTGLIPALAENDYEIDSYKEIMEYSQRCQQKTRQVQDLIPFPQPLTQLPFSSIYKKNQSLN